MESHSYEDIDALARSAVSEDACWTYKPNAADAEFWSGKYSKIFRNQVLYLNRTKSSKYRKSMQKIADELTDRGISWKGTKNSRGDMSEIDVRFGKSLFSILCNNGIDICYAYDGNFYPVDKYVHCTASEKDIVDFLFSFSELPDRINYVVVQNKKMEAMNLKKAEMLAELEGDVIRQKVRDCLEVRNINYELKCEYSGFALEVQVVDNLWLRTWGTLEKIDELLGSIPYVIEHMTCIVPYLNGENGHYKYFKIKYR